jgi:hypothetical protein
MMNITIKGESVSTWVKWIENELEEPRTVPEDAAYVLEAFLESLSTITQLTNQFKTK